MDQQKLIKLIKPKHLKKQIGEQAVTKLVKKHSPNAAETVEWCNHIPAYCLSTAPCRRVALVLLSRLCTVQPQIVCEFFDNKWALGFCPKNLTSKESLGKDLRCLTDILRCVSKVTPPVEHFKKQQALNDRFCCVVSPKGCTPQRLPHIDTQRALVNIWAEFPYTLPTHDTLRTETLIRWLAVFPQKIAQTLEGQRDLNTIIGLISSQWNVEGSKEAQKSLITVFSFSSGHIISNEDPNPEISPCLGKLFERMPSSLKDIATQSVPIICQSFPDDEVYKVIKKFLTFSLTDTVSDWVLVLLNGFCLARKFSLLALATREMSSVVISQMFHTETQYGAFLVLRKLLMGYQHSPDAFHNSLPKLLNVLKFLDQTKVVGVRSHVMASLCEMLYCCMYQHTGHPELYTPLVLQIRSLGCESPDEFVMQHNLKEAVWIGTQVADWRGLVGSEVIAKSSTGKSGLKNMGATCYINSVLQALYMTDAFRADILQSDFEKQSQVSRQLQRTFAFLTLTERHAYDPSLFLKSVSPMFGNRQEDASEFSKYLLDQVHMDFVRIQDAQKKVSETEEKEETTMPQPPVKRLLRRYRPDSHFGGLLKNTVVCSHCQCESSSFEPFTELSIAFGHEGASPTVEDMVEGYLEPELLTGEDAYFCSVCQTKRDAEKRLQIAHTPQNLVVCLKRFSYDIAAQRRKKILTEVACPALLHIPVVSDVSMKNIPSSAGEPLKCDVSSEGNSSRKMSVDSPLPDSSRPSEMATTSSSTSTTSSSSSSSSALNQSFFNASSSSQSSSENPGSQLHPNLECSHEKASKSASVFDENADETHLYVLYAAVVHSGSSAQYGHYYTIGRHSSEAVKDLNDFYEAGSFDEQKLENAVRQGSWCLFNDSSVTRSSYATLEKITSTFRTDVAYILFYRKVDRRSSPKASIDMLPKLSEAVQLDNRMIYRSS